MLFALDLVPYQLALARPKGAFETLERQISLTQREVNTQRFSAAASRANIARAEAQLKQASDTLNRVEPLLAESSSPPSRSTRRAGRSAEAALEFARQDTCCAQPGGGERVDALVARTAEFRAAVRHRRVRPQADDDACASGSSRKARMNPARHTPLRLKGSTSPGLLTLSQYLAQSSIKPRRFSNKSPRR